MPDERPDAPEEIVMDAEELRSCFDEGCELVVDDRGRILGRDTAGSRDGSLQVLSKLRRWY